MLDFLIFLRFVDCQTQVKLWSNMAGARNRRVEGRLFGKSFCSAVSPWIRAKLSERMVEMDLDELARAEAEELSRSLEEIGEEGEGHQRRKREEHGEQGVDSGKRQRTSDEQTVRLDHGRSSSHDEAQDDNTATLVQVTASDGRVLTFRKRAMPKPKTLEVRLDDARHFRQAVVGFTLPKTKIAVMFV
jgi:hypothetical protein